MDDRLVGGPTNSFLADLYTGTGDIFADTGNNESLSNDTYLFLKQKLTEANATIASFTQREANLHSEVEQIKREKHDALTQINILRSELQNLRTKQLNDNHKIDAETRQRFAMQDKVAGAENQLSEKNHHISVLEAKVKETSRNLSTSESFTKQVYKLAADVCEQNNTLKEEMKVQEEIITVCKTTIMRMKEEESISQDEIQHLKKEYLQLDNTLQDSQAEIDVLKEEAVKQSAYINDTLNRFKEIGLHFSNMKTYFCEQHKTLEEYHRELEKKCTVEQELKDGAISKLREIEQLQQATLFREAEHKSKIEKLEESLDALFIIRQNLEEKNKNSEKIIEDLRYNLCHFKEDYLSSKAQLEAECKQNQDSSQIAEREKSKKEGWKIKCEEMTSHIKEMEISTMNLKNENNSLHQKVLDMENTRSKIHDMNEKLNAGNEHLNAENKWLKENLKKKENEIESFVIDGNDIESCLKQRHEDYTKLEQKFKVLSHQKDKLNREKDNLEKLSQELQKSNNENSSQVQELEEKLHQFQYRCMENERALSSMSEKLSNYASINAENERIIQSLQCQTTELKNALRESYQTMEEHTRELTETKHQLQNAVSEKENITDKLTSHLKQITLVMENDEGRLQNECNEKENKISLLQKQLEKQSEISETDRTQIAKLEKRLAALTQKNEAFSDEITRLKDAQSNLENTIEKYNEKESALQSELEMCGCKLKEMEVKLNEEKQLFEKHKEMVAMYDRLWETERTDAINEINKELKKTYGSRNNTNDSSLLGDAYPH